VLLKVNYNYSKQKQMYELMPGSSCLQHNHQHQILEKLTFNGKAVIQYEGELNPQEYGMISLMSSLQLSAPEFQVHLRSIFPNKIFHKPLLANIKTKVLDNMHGEDRHNLPALATYYHLISSDRVVVVYVTLSLMTVLGLNQFIFKRRICTSTQCNMGWILQSLLMVPMVHHSINSQPYHGQALMGLG
jgi:hypothetical protein